jgi:hypothetical protein
VQKYRELATHYENILAAYQLVGEEAALWEELAYVGTRACQCTASCQRRSLCKYRDASRIGGLGALRRFLRGRRQGHPVSGFLHGSLNPHRHTYYAILRISQNPSARGGGTYRLPCTER